MVGLSAVRYRRDEVCLGFVFGTQNSLEYQPDLVFNVSAACSSKLLASSVGAVLAAVAPQCPPGSWIGSLGGVY